jgi:pimeloyl-ACP methyl ester carboxylesterase
MKKGGNVMIFMLLTFFGTTLLLLFYLLAISPGNPAAYKDETGRIPEGSIAEKVFVTIGGVKQGMIIRSKNIDNPVLLYLHGGPGFPVYYLIEKLNPGLEEYFTVCYWEQRGGGLSYSQGVNVESMNLEQLRDDAIEVTHYLRRRFGKEKIFVLGHSGGTTVALPVVSKAPELYHAYIAVAQMTKQSVSERIAYEFMMKQFVEKNNRRSIKRMMIYRNLETDSDLLAFYNSGVRDMFMHRLGIGTMKEMRSVARGIFFPSWTCRAYTLREKLNLWKSKFFFLPNTNLRSETLWADFPTAFPAIEVPVIFTCGRFDYTVNVDLTRDYYNNLNAPMKAFHTFENSAHSPLFEEPERFREIIVKDILQGAGEIWENNTPEVKNKGIRPGESHSVTERITWSGNFTAIPCIF